MSPIAKIPGTLVSKAEVSTGTRLFSSAMPQFATGPSFMVRPKNGNRVSHVIFEIAGLTDLQIQFSRSHQRAHLFDAVRGRAEIVTTVQQRHASGNRVQSE